MARKLIEQDKVDIILGPLSGSEGIAMRDYSKTIPDKTVINGISGALETTWVDPSRTSSGSIWTGPVGYGPRLCRHKKGWKRVADDLGRLFLRATPNFLGFAVDFLQGRRRIRGAPLGSLGSGDFGGVYRQVAR
jgi:hypothetical protein